MKIRETAATPCSAGVFASRRTAKNEKYNKNQKIRHNTTFYADGSAETAAAHLAMRDGVIECDVSDTHLSPFFPTLK